MLDQYKRIWGGIKKYLFKDTRYFFLYLFRYFQGGYRHTCIFYDKQELSNLLKNGKSLIRLGDGEIGLVHFLKIHYQEYSDSIRNDFKNIISDYSNKSPYILAIPLFVNYSNQELRALGKGKLACWLPLKVTYELLFNKKATYADAHLFYRDYKFSELIVPLLNDKKIVLVTHARNKERCLNSAFGKRIAACVCSPEANAYEERERIMAEIIQAIGQITINKNECIVLMAAGLSKTIISDLAKQGYQVLDIGKGLEGYCENVSLEHQI